nr:MAG TPA: hypothetical protein [Caudoviricetes sp.]
MSGSIPFPGAKLVNQQYYEFNSTKDSEQVGTEDGQQDNQITSGDEDRRRQEVQSAADTKIHRGQTLR